MWYWFKRWTGSQRVHLKNSENNPLHDPSNSSILMNMYAQPDFSHQSSSSRLHNLPRKRILRLKRLILRRPTVQLAASSLEYKGELDEQRRIEETINNDAIPEWSPGWKKKNDSNHVHDPSSVLSPGMGPRQRELSERECIQNTVKDSRTMVPTWALANRKSDSNTDCRKSPSGERKSHMEQGTFFPARPELSFEFMNGGSSQKHKDSAYKSPEIQVESNVGFKRAQVVLYEFMQCHQEEPASFSNAASPSPFHKTVTIEPNTRSSANLIHGARSHSENEAFGKKSKHGKVTLKIPKFSSSQEDEESSDEEEDEVQHVRTAPPRSSSTGTYSNSSNKPGIPRNGSYKVQEMYVHPEIYKGTISAVVHSPQSLSPNVPAFREKAQSLPPINIPPRYPLTYFLPSGAPSTSASSTSTSPRPPLTPVDLKMPVKGLWVKSKKPIGSGGFGKVYKCRNNETGIYFAAKVVPTEVAHHLDQMKHEINIMKKIGRHPNIVHYIGTEMDERSVTIFLELMENGSLHNVLKEFPEPLDERTICTYTRQVLKGLAHLHEMDVVHRDVKGRNILLDMHGTAKLADFGLSKFLVNDMTSTADQGTVWWMAPEAINVPGETMRSWECGEKKDKEEVQKQGYGKAVDIWSLGCTVIEMATGGLPPWFDPKTEKPFWVPANDQSWERGIKVQAIYRIGKATGPPPIPDLLSDLAKDFIRSCCQVDPSHRPTAQNLLQHPFIHEAPSGLQSPLYFKRDMEVSGSQLENLGEGEEREGLLELENRRPANAPHEDRDDYHHQQHQENPSLHGVQSPSVHISSNAQSFEDHSDASHMVTGSQNSFAHDLTIALKQLQVVQESTATLAARGNRRNSIPRKTVL